MIGKLLPVAGALAFSAWAFSVSNAAAEKAVQLPAPVLDTPSTHATQSSQATQETAVFAGGFFWGVQAVFQHTRGVLNAVSGYAGGDPQQVAARYIAQLDAAQVFPRKIVTQLAPLTGFYRAEDYLQDYATLHPQSPDIVRFDQPRIAHLKTLMPELYREKPVLVAAQGGG